MEFFSDATAMFEAFKAGELTSHRESNAQKWAEQFDFPRAQSGDVVKSEVAHERPTGMTGFAMNTRREIFKDWRVREAMIQAFNFEFINTALNGGDEPRITSYFSNSVLGMGHGPAEGRVLELLEAHKDTLHPGAIEGYNLPVSDGSQRNRKGIVRAQELLSEAGYEVKDGVMTSAQGKPLSFTILASSGSSEVAAILNIYAQALERIGVFVTVETIDSAQYRERTDQFDFDMTYFRRVDAMVQEMLTVSSREDYLAAVKAMDRMLMAGRYVIPIWYSPISRLAHNKEMKRRRVICRMCGGLSLRPHRQSMTEKEDKL